MEKYHTIKSSHDGSKVKYGIENNNLFYLKGPLTKAQIANYKKAEDLKIGVPISGVNTKGEIKMEAGIPVQKAINEGKITAQTAEYQLNNIQEVLYQQKLAHCDIKEDNIRYFPRLKEIRLIDNGELTPYGPFNIRPVHTPFLNTTLGGHGEIGVGPYTDAKGFGMTKQNLYDPNQLSFLSKSKTPFYGANNLFR